MSDRHEWTDPVHDMPCVATPDSDEVFDGERMIIDGISGREILRLAGFKETLEKVARALGCLPTQFSDAYGHVLERAEALAARVKELEEEVEILGACKECGMGRGPAGSPLCECPDPAAGLQARVKELEAEINAREATLHMTVARLGGQVEGGPTHRGNFLQRVDELREMEARATLLEPIVAPLMPLFSEILAFWGRLTTPASPCPDTVTLTAEFPVEALRALTKE